MGKSPQKPRSDRRRQTVAGTNPHAGGATRRSEVGWEGWTHPAEEEAEVTRKASRDSCDFVEKERVQAASATLRTGSPDGPGCLEAHTHRPGAVQAGWLGLRLLRGEWGAVVPLPGLRAPRSASGPTGPVWSHLHFSEGTRHSLWNILDGWITTSCLFFPFLSLTLLVSSRALRKTKKNPLYSSPLTHLHVSGDEQK